MVLKQFPPPNRAIFFVSFPSSSLSSFPGSLHVDQLGALVAPEGALGGASVLSCLERNVPLIVVSNSNVLNVTSQALDLKNEVIEKKNSILLHANNFIEAAGLIVLLREGISAESLCRPISRIGELN